MVCHHHWPCSSVLSPVPSVWLKCIFQEIIFSSFELLLPTLKLTCLNFFGTKPWLKPAVFFSYLALLLQEVLKCCCSDFLGQVAQLKASCYLFPSPLFCNFVTTRSSSLFFCSFSGIPRPIRSFVYISRELSSTSREYDCICLYIFLII